MNQRRRHAMQNWPMLRFQTSTAAEKRVILCGGTGLYLRALCEGLVATPPADPSLRAKLRSEAEQHGAATLHTSGCR